MKVLSLFSGIGAFEVALKRLGKNVNLVAYCDIDKYASKSYATIHNVSEEMNLWDVTKIDTSTLPKDIDLITYGFPCQDISLAGKQKGFHDEDGSLTRSGLFFEALKIIEDTKPRIAIAENVKNLTSKKFSEHFQIVLNSLEEAGYNNYWKVLNAKDYGVPQNRERVFIVSIRKDIDNGDFEFPKPFPLQKRLKDVLEDDVDEKYYLSERCIKGFIEHTKRHEAKGTGFKWEVRDLNGYASCLRANAALAPTDNTIEIKQVAQIYPNSGNPQAGRIYDSDGISPAKDTCQGGNRMPKVMVKEATKKGYAEAVEGDSINLEQPNSKTRRGRVGKGVAQTLTTSCNQGVVEPVLRIRKLTPKECWRLMGFDDESFAKAEAINSNTQLYKQAGNSIVVDVLELIFGQLIRGEYI